MKRLVISAAAIAATAVFTPMPSIAQGIGIDVPGVGVRIGEPGYRHYRSYDGPVVRERRAIVSGTSACVAAAGR